MNTITHAAAAATLSTALIAVPAGDHIEVVQERRADPEEKGGRRTQDAVPAVVLATGDDAPMPRLTAAQRRKAESQARVRTSVADSLARYAAKGDTPVEPEQVSAAPAPAPTPAPAPAQEMPDHAAAKMLDAMRVNEVKDAVPLPTDGYQGPMRALRERLKAGAYTKMANGQPANGDEVATLLGALNPTEVIKACMMAMALTANPYQHLNVGQQSMNLRNKLRGMLKRGEFGMGVLREAVEEVVEARPAPAPATSAAQMPAPAPEPLPPVGAVEEPSKVDDPVSAKTRSAASKKANASRTPATRSAASKKAAATRAAK